MVYATVILAKDTVKRPKINIRRDTMKRFFAILLCAFLLMSTVCAVAENEVQLRFSWWGGDERHEATLATMAAYGP